MSVAVWTTISRVSGVLRGITIAAVLGATYFANTYQFTNSLPNLIFYGLLAGSLFSSLLVPALVKHIDSGDKRAAERVAGGLMGVALLAMLAVVPVAALLTPLLLKLGSLGSASAAAHGQAGAGAILVAAAAPAGPAVRVHRHVDRRHERASQVRAGGRRARAGEPGHDRRARRRLAEVRADCPAGFHAPIVADPAGRRHDCRGGAARVRAVVGRSPGRSHAPPASGLA